MAVASGPQVVPKWLQMGPSGPFSVPQVCPTGGVFCSTGGNFPLQGVILLHRGSILLHKGCIFLHRQCVLLHKGCILLYIHQKTSKSTIAAKGGPRSETTYRFRAVGKWKANTSEIYNE